MNGIEEVKKILTEIVISYHENANLAIAGEIEHYPSIVETLSQICQLFPQPLGDKKLREKLAGIYYGLKYSHLFKDLNTAISHYRREKFVHLPSWRQPFLDGADQILALLPSIEEAKREERERIIEIVVKELERQKIIVHTHPLYGGDYCQMCLFVKAIRQALKGGE